MGEVLCWRTLIVVGTLQLKACIYRVAGILRHLKTRIKNDNRRFCVCCTRLNSEILRKFFVPRARHDSGLPFGGITVIADTCVIGLLCSVVFGSILHFQCSFQRSELSAHIRNTHIICVGETIMHHLVIRRIVLIYRKSDRLPIIRIKIGVISIV